MGRADPRAHRVPTAPRCSAHEPNTTRQRWSSLLPSMPETLRSDADLLPASLRPSVATVAPLLPAHRGGIRPVHFAPEPKEEIHQPCEPSGASPPSPSWPPFAAACSGGAASPSPAATAAPTTAPTEAPSAAPTEAPTPTPDACAPENLALKAAGRPDHRHRQPGLPAVLRGGRRGVHRALGEPRLHRRPRERQGLRERRRVRRRRQARLRQGQGDLGRRAVHERVRAGRQDVRLRHQPGLLQARAGRGGRPVRRVLQPQPGRGRAQGQRGRRGQDPRRPQGLQVRGDGRHDELRRDRQRHRADDRPVGLRHERRGASRPSRPSRSTPSSSTCPPPTST